MHAQAKHEGQPHHTTPLVHNQLPAFSASDAVCACTPSPLLADKLGKQLRSVEGTALKVVGVQSISSASRQTCAFFPLPHPLAGGGTSSTSATDCLPRCLEPIEVLVQLESSGEALVEVWEARVRC